MDNSEKLATQDKQNKNTTQYMYVLDATIGKQTQKKPEVKTNRTSFPCGNCNGHHNTERKEAQF